MYANTNKMSRIFWLILRGTVEMYPLIIGTFFTLQWIQSINNATNDATKSYQLFIFYRFHLGEPKIGNQGMINTAAATNTHIHYPRDAVAKPQHQQQHYHYHHVNEQMQRKNSYSEASSAFSGSDTMQVRTSKYYFSQELSYL